MPLRWWVVALLCWGSVAGLGPGALPAEQAPARTGRTAEVIVPSQPIPLFDGTDLSAFYTWLVDHRFEDPDRVFTVVDQIDGAPALRISGQHWGGIITRERYADYRLVAEFRWGAVTWGERKNRARDSGILLHCQGPEGNYQPDFNGPWMHSIEYQIIEGGTGDIILVRGYTPDGQLRLPRLTATVREQGGRLYWDPRGEPRTLEGGRVNWFGKDPGWDGSLGFRGRSDVERPLGQWNRVEIICQGDELTYLLNDQMVNQARGSSLTEGKILFQSEGAEIYFRNIILQPL